MRIACLIIGYRAAPILAQSLPILRAAGFDLFVHVDAKIDQTVYLNILGPSAQISHVLEDRVDVFWGGYTLMLVGLKLLQAARAHARYDRYLLISDDAFPVLPPHVLASRLESADDLIAMTRQPEGNVYHQRYSKFFFYDHPVVRERGPRTREIDEDFEDRIAEIAAFRRIGKKPIDVYFGSQFWCLTNTSAEYLLDTVQNDLHLVKSFEYSALPDELMVQSIIGNKYRENRATAPIFEDFPHGSGPTVFSAMEQVPQLPARALFLRKIHPAAVEFATKMSNNLRRGYTAFGYSPDLPYFFTAFFRNQHTVVNLLLAAPDHDSDGWHGAEGYFGRRYRWSNSGTLDWLFELPGLQSPAILHLYVPIVFENDPDMLDNCHVVVDDRMYKMFYGARGLNATVPYSGGENVMITLRNPPPKPVPHDRRHLGIAVAMASDLELARSVPRPPPPGADAT